MNSSVYQLTILQITLIVMIAGMIFWAVATWAVTRKMQPVIEQERALRLQSEMKRQEETQRAEEALEKSKAEIAEAASRQAALERLLAGAQDHAKEDATKIESLEADLTKTQKLQTEAEAQVTSIRSRVIDLEAALEAEKGRISAMQEALEAKQDLAKQLAQELSSARNSFADERRIAQEREAALNAKLQDHEKSLSSENSMADVINAELEKTRAAQADIERESAIKMAELQRKLAAADQKSALLQKELMVLINNTGNVSDAAAVVTAAEEIAQAQERARQAELKATDLEAQLSQGDAGARKRLREAEYKICELEYKLAQLEEGKVQAST